MDKVKNGRLRVLRAKFGKVLTVKKDRYRTASVVKTPVFTPVKKDLQKIFLKVAFLALSNVGMTDLGTLALACLGEARGYLIGVRVCLCTRFFWSSLVQ